MTAMVECRLGGWEVFQILVLVAWAIFSNPFLEGVHLPKLLDVPHKEGIACELTSPFLLRKQYLAAEGKLKYSALRIVLHVMAQVASREQIPKLALSAVEQDR